MAWAPSPLASRPIRRYIEAVVGGLSGGTVREMVARLGLLPCKLPCVVWPKREMRGGKMERERDLDLVLNESGGIAISYRFLQSL